MELTAENQKFLETVKLVSATGIRSLSGPTALAKADHPEWVPIVNVARVGEMVLDKMPFLPGRDSVLVMAQRAVMGGLVARTNLKSTSLKGKAWPIITGAATSMAVGYLASKIREKIAQKSSTASFAAGFVEDAIVTKLLS